MGPIKISTIAAKHDFLIVGGYGGEFAARSLLSSNDQQPVHTGYITRVNNGITNHMNIEDTRGGG